MVFLAWLALAAITPQQAEFFEKNIRPLFARQCHSCHNSKSKTAFAGLRLDTEAGLRKGSDTGPVVVPGDPRGSRLIRAVKGELPQRMPPTGALKDAEIAALEEWVKMGAPWPEEAPAPSLQEGGFNLEERRRRHWAWQPVKAVAPPQDVDAVNQVDRFLRVALRKKGLEPAARADALTLLRRVRFDLTGLPPTLEEVAAFEKDSSPAAYTALVDSLIGSPQFGERWARRWMDVIRYSESHGSEGDPDIPHAWRYRDYLIRAFNEDVPYDQLIREHIAGDLLPRPRINGRERINESAIGPAHLRMIEHGFQPVDPWEDRVKWTDNQVDVFSKAFQGLTISCARCHDHKFDAISQKDFYALFGVFAGARPTQVSIEAPGQESLYAELRRRKEEIRRGLAETWRDSVAAAVERLAQTGGTRDTPASLWRMVQKGAGELEVAYWNEELKLRRAVNAREFARGLDVRKSFAGWVAQGAVLPAVSQAGEFAIPASGDRLINAIYPGGVYSHLLSARNNLVVSSPRFTIDTDNISIRTLGGQFSNAQLIVENYAVPRGGIYHMRFAPKQDRMGWWRWDTTYWKGFKAYVEWGTYDDLTHFQLDPEQGRMKPRPEPPKDGRSYFGIQQIVFHDSSETPREDVVALSELLDGGAPADIEQLAARIREKLAAAVDAFGRGSMTESQAALLDWFVRAGLLPATAAELPTIAAGLRQYQAAENEIRVARRAPGIVEEAPGPQRLLVRGNLKNPGEPVPQRYLTALDSRDYPDPGHARLRLAEEVASPRNPLTARVMVNRIWQSLFRKGLVRTVDNFGKLGEPPSHPELLDWLAQRFVDDGWSIKKTVRLLALSDAYQSASAKASEADPDNRLLQHMNVRRLEAEEIRDAILAASGQLDATMFGKSIDTYYAHDTGKTKGDKPKGPLDGAGRRSVYLEVRRNVTNPFLEVFDVPKPSTTRGERDVTTVPAQSLALLNSEFVVDQSTKWAARLQGDPHSRIEEVFLRALGRKPTSAERDQAMTYLSSLAGAHQAEVADARVWRDFTHAVFNLKEFLYVR